MDVEGTTPELITFGMKSQVRRYRANEPLFGDPQIPRQRPDFEPPLTGQLVKQNVNHLLQDVSLPHYNQISLTNDLSLHQSLTTVDYPP